MDLIRKQVDWATIYYSEPVAKSRYLSISSDVDDVRIAGVSHRFEVYDKSASVVLSSDDGWYVRVQDPEWEQIGPIKPYPIEIQARGRMWAGGVDIWRALDDWEAWLGLDVVPEDRIPGRTDLAADIWIKDLPFECPLFWRDRKMLSQPSAYELYRIIIGEGDDEKIPEVWAARSRRNDGGANIDLRVVGQKKNARTLYLGHRKGIQLAIYNKTAEFGGNTAELVRGEWLKGGWDPDNGLVARFEFRFSREVIREQTFPVLDKETGEITRVDGNEIDFQQFMEALPDVWDTCLTRIRLAPYDGRTALTRQRSEAPLWTRLRRSPPTLRGPGYGEALVAIKRGYDVDKLKTDTVRKLINIQHALGPLGPDAVMRRLERREPEDEAYRNRTPWKGHLKRRRGDGTGSGRRQERKDEGRILPLPEGEGE